MRITFKETDQKDGTSDFLLKVTNGELNFLITFALESLINLGAVVVDQNLTDVEQTAEIPVLDEDATAPVTELPGAITKH